MMEEMLAQATVKSYRKAWDEYATFHIRQYHRGPKFPVTKEKVMMFVAHLDLKKFAKSTIRTYVSAIAYPHRMSEETDPTTGGVVKKLLDKAGSLAVQRPSKKAIIKKLLHKLLQAATEIFTPYKATLMKAVFSAAFHICARIGELAVSNGNTQHVLPRNQIRLIRVQGNLVEYQVTFKSFKHSKNRIGSRTVPVSHGRYCPVRLMANYLTARPDNVHASEPIFVWPSGKVLRSSEVSKALQEALTAVGENPKEFSAHGFRIGGATEAAQQGASDAELRMLGRWNSSAFLTYVRPQSTSFRYK
jgi:site-specific recombinase XerD